MRKPIIAIVTLATISVLGWFLLGPGYKWKARSFFRQMQMVATPTQVQKWALDEIERADGKQVELDSLPSFFDALDDGPPNSAYVESSGGQSYLVSQWGGGFGHWGLLVGSPSLEYPHDDSYHIEWAPGVYVWYEIQK